MSEPAQPDYSDPVAFIRQCADALRGLKKHLDGSGQQSPEFAALSVAAGLLSGTATNIERERKTAQEAV